ncbi:hypothetical protein AAMO2058_001728500, partial [Amorphochlora amoebiformis]
FFFSLFFGSDFYVPTVAFAAWALSVVSEKCSSAKTVGGDDFRLEENAQAALAFGAAVVIGFVIIQTFVNCTCQVRGELTDPAFDEGRECPDTVSYWCCCKSFRARPWRDVKCFKFIAKGIKRTCSFCSTYLASLVYTLTRLLFNCIFLATCQPIGWALETAWVNRHFISP